LRTRVEESERDSSLQSEVQSSSEKMVLETREVEDSEIVQLDLKFVHCPIQTTLQVLGKKWTLLILRDIGFRKIDRFNRLLETVRGVTPRVLSMRLKELERTGYIKCKKDRRSALIVRWALTRKGRDTLPILLRILLFGSKWYPEIVFEDEGARSRLNQIFTRKEMKILHKYA
jgi:DNA-binding HxlR family transcriptional regulator